MLINKQTKLFGSFSSCPGNFGASVFNMAFEYCCINAIYKPFSVINIKNSLWAMEALGITGAAVSSPFKVEVLKYAHYKTDDVLAIGAANTVTCDCDVFTAHNTDWLAAKETLKKFNHPVLVVLGNGGYSKAVQYAASKLGKEVKLITRDSWSSIGALRDQLVFNATPVSGLSSQIHASNILIDCIVGTETGNDLALLQASYQFELYTGTPFPMKYIRSQPGQWLR